MKQYVGEGSIIFDDEFKGGLPEAANSFLSEDSMTLNNINVKGL
jgi:hypothetical protein